MSVRVSWNAPAALADDLIAVERVEDVGIPIHLDDATEHVQELQDRLIELVREENVLYAAGLRCQIKLRHDTACSACPLYDPGDELCQLGREQERLTTTLTVIHVGR